MTELPRVLCVDDEPNILDGLRRTLGLEFEIVTADGPMRGLERADTDGPFAVVVSDMKMPVMDGAAFLAEMRRRSPDTVRVLLTGQADLDAAARAVNEGEIFRFLQKPCPPERLREVVLAAVAHFRLIRSEREVLEQTLKGAVRVLSQVLQLVHPVAFGRSDRVAAYVRHMSRSLALHEPWRVEVAALLSQIGCVALPADLLARRYAGQPLTPKEEARYAKHTRVACELLAGIPRLEPVVEMIRRQESAATDAFAFAPVADDVALGAEVLRLALALEQRESAGQPLADAIEDLGRVHGGFDPRLLASLEGLEDSRFEVLLREIHAADLVPGMVLDEDLHGRDGLLLAAKGLEMQPGVIHWLNGMAEGGRLTGSFRVRQKRTSLAA